MKKILEACIEQILQFDSEMEWIAFHHNLKTGRKAYEVLSEEKQIGIDVIIAANVIQNEAVELFKDYLVFATRLSKNSFVGVNQSKQTGKTGPDTADRLFNLIKKRY